MDCGYGDWNRSNGEKRVAYSENTMKMLDQASITIAGSAQLLLIFVFLMRTARIGEGRQSGDNWQAEEEAVKAPLPLWTASTRTEWRLRNMREREKLPAETLCV